MRLLHSNILHIALFLYLSINIESVLSQQNYTKFINSVCDNNDEFYDKCSCNLAYWTTNKQITTTPNITCWNALNCPYDINTNEFCNGNGYCDFQEGACKCDRAYGSSDCSQKFKETRPTEWVMILMVIISAILALMSIALMIWVHLYRDVKDVKAMSVVFTHLTLVGCAFICCGTIVIGIGYNDVNCVILEWFQFIGIWFVVFCFISYFRIFAYSQKYFFLSLHVLYTKQYGHWLCIIESISDRGDFS